MGPAMVPGDEIDNAISISNDEDGDDDSPSKVETPELCDIKAEFSGCKEDGDEPKIKEKQDAGDDDSESEAKYNVGAEMKGEKQSVK